MSATQKYIILKLDERSAETDDQPTSWVQMADVEKGQDDYASPARVLSGWLAESQPSATAAGEYLVVRVEDTFGACRFTVTPRVEFDVEAASVVEADEQVAA